MSKEVESFKVRFQKALDFRQKKPVDVAKALGINESTISQYRSGYSEPKAERLNKIATYLRVDPTWLMGMDVPMAPRDYRLLSEVNTDLQLEIMTDVQLGYHVRLLAYLSKIERADSIYDIIETFYEKEINQDKKGN